ncbi:hypothetical protein D9615_004036 [Tricholomella constricta]|uniref:Small heat shock protein n=1 Tax=Tricholomella constricta TaxID=117010 RepID=A0A8H5M4M4_9AGAR|nr:hypothetical protein D9615_004036 [Tricholomella constricta]
MMSQSALYYEPFYDFDRFFEAFSPLTHTQALRGRRALDNEDRAIRSLNPRMDLHENAQTNTVTATFELPGLKKEDVNIEHQNGRLTISAETKLSEEYEKSGYAVRERRFGKVSRTLQLPQGVKDEEIKASMENGLLTVTFPKTAPELTPKTITVS